jgi:hypothetical protein
MAKKKQHGGAREGAGREPVNPEGVTGRVTVTVPESLIKQLDAVGKRNGWNRSKAVTEAIRGLVATPKRG